MPYPRHVAMDIDAYLMPTTWKVKYSIIHSVNSSMPITVYDHDHTWMIAMFEQFRAFSNWSLLTFRLFSNIEKTKSKENQTLYVLRNAALYSRHSWKRPEKPQKTWSAKAHGESQQGLGIVGIACSWLECTSKQNGHPQEQDWGEPTCKPRQLGQMPMTSGTNLSRFRELSTWSNLRNLPAVHPMGAPPLDPRHR